MSVHSTVHTLAMSKQIAMTLRGVTSVTARQGMREMDIIAQVRPTLVGVCMAGGFIDKC